MSDPSVRATDALANERTFLAYVRTALAFVAFGFVIARFALFAREISAVAHVHVPTTGISKGFGIAMVVLGMLVGVLGGVRYGATDRALRRGESEALPSAVAYTGAVLIVIIGAIVVVGLFRF